MDGPAARALAGLARGRWCRARGQEAGEATSGTDRWPDSVMPDFTDVRIGISRTEPGRDHARAVREVEKLFFDSIDAAEEKIYIENQFLTSTSGWPSGWRAACGGRSGSKPS